MSQETLFGASEERRLDLSQWYTNPRLCERVWEWSRGASATSILEPSAGHGALIMPSVEGGHLHKWAAYDVDPTNIDFLRERLPGLDIRARDWMGDPEPGRFDLCIMNPPYEGDQDAAHVLKAIRHCDRVVAVLRSTYDHCDSRWKSFWRHVRPTRKVNLVGRPKFGGGGSPKSDFKIYEFAGGIRAVPREYGEEVSISESWWP